MNERERLFVKEYLIDLNGKRSAIRAGYTKSTAARTAGALLRKTDIAAAVAAGKEQRASRRQMLSDRVIDELARMAFSDLRDFVEWGPNKGVTLRDPAFFDAADGAAVADVEDKGNGKVARLKLYDKLAALNALARHLGMIGGRAALGPVDQSRDGEDARAVLLERLSRLADKNEG